MINPAIVLVIEGTYPWYRGGVSEWVSHYIRAFPDIDFHIVQIATDEYLNTHLTRALYTPPEQVRSFIRIAPPHLNKEWDKVSADWFHEVLPAIRHSFSQSDIIHVANTGFAGWLGAEMAQKADKPLVLTEHALYWKEVEMGAVALECGYKIPEYESEKEEMMNRFKALARHIYKQADVVISVSKCNMSYQREMGADAVRYIPNGVSTSWLQPGYPQNELLTLGWIGRCAAMKNPLKFFDVIRAFQTYDAVEIKFLMMLCDANEPGLAEKVTDESKRYSNIELIWNEATGDHLQKMDALCITSYNESQPLVLFEALSHKILPVGWEAGDVTSEYGLILNKKQSAQQLAEAITILWKRPDKWRSMVDNCFLKVKEGHTWEQIFKQYRALFTSYFTLA